KRAEENKAAAANNPRTSEEKIAPRVAQAQASVQAASSRAGAYLSSWGAWASEKRKNWQKPEANNAPAEPTPLTLASTETWAAEDSRPAVTSVSELSKERKNVGQEDDAEDDAQRTHQEDVANQVAAEDPWAQEKI
ncbi:hypothetical protein KCU60_g13287, partial [Aureobasidium melanogenum]